VASEVDVLGFVNDAHAAAPQLLEYPVVRDRSADHRWAIGLQMVGRAHIEVNVIAGPSCAVDCLIDTDGIFSDIVVKGATDLIEANYSTWPASNEIA